MATRIVDPTIAIGSVLRGLRVSSASGATDSKPESARIVKTTPSQSPLPLGVLPGLNDETLKPPWPGEIRPERPSTVKTPTSKSASTSSTLIDSATPKYVKTNTAASRMKNVMYHERWKPYCACSVLSTRLPVKAETAATATGS